MCVLQSCARRSQSLIRIRMVWSAVKIWATWWGRWATCPLRWNWLSLARTSTWTVRHLSSSHLRFTYVLIAAVLWFDARPVNVFCTDVCSSLWLKHCMFHLFIYHVLITYISANLYPLSASFFSWRKCRFSGFCWPHGPKATGRNIWNDRTERVERCI